MEINKVYNVDCRDFLRTLPDNSIDLIVTDPPYPVISRGSAGNSGGMLQKDLSLKGKIFEHNSISPQEYLPEFYRVLKEGTHCYIMTNHYNLIEFLNVATEAGFHFTKSLIWNKGNKIMGQFYMSQFEYILFFRKGKAKKINNCGTSDILSIPNKKTKDENGQNIHDTEKPVALMEILIENSSNKGDLVLDPFAGVGSVVLGCQNLDRNYLACELDSNYYNTINKRLDQNTGNILNFVQLSYD